MMIRMSMTSCDLAGSEIRFLSCIPWQAEIVTRVCSIVGIPETRGLDTWNYFAWNMLIYLRLIFDSIGWGSHLWSRSHKCVFLFLFFCFSVFIFLPTVLYTMYLATTLESCNMQEILEGTCFWSWVVFEPLLKILLPRSSSLVTYCGFWMAVACPWL